MFTLTMETTKKEWEETHLQLALLAMPPKKRQRAMWRLANEIKKHSIQNAKRQRNPDGTSWKDRKYKRKKGNKDKMLRYMPKMMAIKDTPEFGRIYFKRGFNGKSKYHSGVISNMHGQGYSFKKDAVTHTASLSRSEKVRHAQEQPATRKQALFLRKLGYKRRGQRKGRYARASTKWITENMDQGQAGLIIRMLQNAPHHQQWTIHLPKREFLGATKAEETKYFHRVMRDINYGWNVKKQDMKG